MGEMPHTITAEEIDRLEAWIAKNGFTVTVIMDIWDGTIEMMEERDVLVEAAININDLRGKKGKQGSCGFVQKCVHKHDWDTLNTALAPFQFMEEKSCSDPECASGGEPCIDHVRL